jgi:hypothetical protein
METKGIKETQELIEGVKVLAIAGTKVMADGKITVTDLPAGMELFSKSQVVIDGFTGLAEIQAEVKDLSEEECRAIVAQLFAAAAAVRAAKTA